MLQCFVQEHSENQLFETQSVPVKARKILFFVFLEGLQGALCQEDTALEWRINIQSARLNN